MTPMEMEKKPASTAMTRHCPRCVQRPLETCSYGGREVDVCPKCAGLWCEPADWDSEALGARPASGVATEASFAGTGCASNKPTVEIQVRADRACPSCRRLLTAVRAGGPEGCAVDRCDQCGGVWFDHGEWEHLECLQTFRAHQQDLDRVTTWREWAFQFFLRLPIEFNVRVRRTPVVTVVMMVLCSIAFLEQLAVDPDRWQVFATSATRIWRGEGLYTLITSSFLHGNFLHLLGNMYFLYILGDNVEDALGRWRYTLLYLGCAVLSSFMHVAIFPKSDVPLVGASGAVFGVMAAYLLLYPTARLTMMLVFWQVKLPFWAWMGFYLVVQALGAILTLPGQSSGIAYWGHLGGFLAGFLLIFPQRRVLIQNHPLLRLLHHYRLPAGAGIGAPGKQKAPKKAQNNRE